MPYKFKQSVRNESKEIVELLLNSNKRKRSYSSEFSSGSIEVVSFDGEDFDKSDYENLQNSSSEESSDNIFEDMDIKKEIAAWAVKHTITNSAVNDLLIILRKSFKFLPKDARTLKQTPRDTPIVPIQGGNYVHYGIKDCLTDFLSSNSFLDSCIDLNINIDGLPVSKSSLAQAWPILININVMVARFSKVVEPMFLRLTNEVNSLRQEINGLRNEIKQLKEEKTRVKLVMPDNPFKVMDEFLEFEKLLQEDDNFLKSFEKELLTVAKHPNFTKNCWRKLLQDELAEQLCWKGTADKKSVRNLSAARAIRNCAISVGVGEDEYIRSTKSFFQFAKNRQESRKSYIAKKIKKQ